MERTDRKVYFSLLFVAVMALVVHSLLFSRYTVDDAFISFRYARNLVEGHGLVYNAGERVEGYTNFLWTLIHSLFIWAGVAPDFMAKAVSLTLSIGTLFLITRLAKTWGHGYSHFSTTAAMFWAVSGAVAVSTMTGLETHFFAFLVMLGIVLYSLPNGGARVLGGSIVSFGISTLIRPEGMIFLILTLVHYYANTRRRASWWPVVLAALVVLPHPIWRYLFYNELFPNTFGAKTGGGLLQTQKGFEYIKGFVNEYGKPGLYLLAAMPFIRYPLGKQRSYALLLVVSYLCYVVYAGGDWIPHYRFLIPIMPVIYVALQDGLLSLRASLPAWKGKLRAWPSTAIWLFLGVILFDIGNQSYYLRLHTEMWADGYEHAHTYVGRWLKENAESENTVALMDIGLVGYLSGIDVLDITGLTDPHVAASPGGWLKKSYSLDYLFDRDPEYFVLVSSTDYPKEDFASSFPIDRAVFEDSRLHRRYELLFSRDAYYTRQPHDSGYYLLVFGRRVGG